MTFEIGIFSRRTLNQVNEFNQQLDYCIKIKNGRECANITDASLTYVKNNLIISGNSI